MLGVCCQSYLSDGCTVFLWHWANIELRPINAYLVWICVLIRERRWCSSTSVRFGAERSLWVSGELVFRQWWWAFGWCGCSTGWWEPPGGPSGAHAAQWPPWGASGWAGTRPGRASCPWRPLGAPSSSLGAAPPGDAPCSATGGQVKDVMRQEATGVQVSHWEQNTMSGTLLMSDHRGSRSLWLWSCVCLHCVWSHQGWKQCT